MALVLLAEIVLALSGAAFYGLFCALDRRAQRRHVVHEAERLLASSRGPRR